MNPIEKYVKQQYARQDYLREVCLQLDLDIRESRPGEYSFGARGSLARAYMSEAELMGISFGQVQDLVLRKLAAAEIAARKPVSTTQVECDPLNLNPRRKIVIEGE